MVKITVRVKTGIHREEKVIQISQTEFVVETRAKPIKGEANKKIIELLSKYLKVPKSKIEILKGLSTNIKQVIINS